MNGTKSTLPENLTALWDYTHNRECAKSGAECGKLWQKLEEKLTEKLKNTGIPGLDGDDRESKARDAANEYLVTILKSERRPDHIFSTSLLVRDMRKYLARTRNPVQYEMSRILSTALLELERDGLIKGAVHLRDGLFKAERPSRLPIPRKAKNVLPTVPITGNGVSAIGKVMSSAADRSGIVKKGA